MLNRKHFVARLRRCISIVFHVIIPNVRSAIKDKPPAKPSKPSVKLTAFELATKINKIKMPYNHPISNFIFKECIQSNGSFPAFKNK